MGYTEIKGNIFNSKAMALVNTVNCVGVMGKGIALEFRLRFPEMFNEYASICDRRLLKPGQILPYRKSTPWILNFAIKDDWKYPSKPEWIESTLQRFCANYKSMGIKSVAFPVMGAMNGGIPIEVIWKLTRGYLSKLDDIDVEVYEFDSHATDNLFNTLKIILGDKSLDLKSIILKSDIKKKYWVNIFDVIESHKVNSLYELISYKINDKRVIGKTNIERLYLFLSENYLETRSHIE